MTGTIALLGNRLTLTGTRPPEDALWLAASIPAQSPNTRALEIGTGNGVAALALLVRQPQLHITGVDISPESIHHAEANATHNHLPLYTQVADILTYTPTQPFSLIFSNPPYHAQARGHSTPSTQKALAHSMPENLLTHWLNACHTMLTPQGHIHLIVHTACEEEILSFAKMKNYKTILTPLQTSPQNPPKRLLVQLQKSTDFSLKQNIAIPAYQESLREKILKNAESLFS